MHRGMEKCGKGQEDHNLITDCHLDLRRHLKERDIALSRLAIGIEMTKRILTTDHSQMNITDLCQSVQQSVAICGYKK